MTTIAYRNGVLAGDTRVTMGGRIEPGAQTKVYTLSNGALFGFAGSLAAGLKLLAAIEEEWEDLPQWKSGHTIGFAVRPDRSMWVYEGTGVWIRTRGRFYAIGSGSDYALAAMEAHVSVDARSAVNIAKKYDPNSGGAVKAVKFA